MNSSFKIFCSSVMYVNIWWIFTYNSYSKSRSKLIYYCPYNTTYIFYPQTYLLQHAPFIRFYLYSESNFVVFYSFTSVLMPRFCIFQPLEAAMQQQTMQQNKFLPNYQLVMGQNVPQHIFNRNNIPIPVINIQNVQNKQMLLPNMPQTNLNTNVMCPLSVNINSPMYSLPPSPNTYSPVMSPAQRDRVLSPYSTPQSMSPVGKFNQMYSPGSRLVSPVGIMHAGDPYLTNKMQPSPNFPFQPGELILDTSAPMPSPDFWGDTEMLQGTNELLMAFDDVKLA